MKHSQLYYSIVSILSYKKKRLQRPHVFHDIISFLSYKKTWRPQVCLCNYFMSILYLQKMWRPHVFTKYSISIVQIKNVATTCFYAIILFLLYKEEKTLATSCIFYFFPLLYCIIITPFSNFMVAGCYRPFPFDHKSQAAVTELVLGWVTNTLSRMKYG